MNRLLLPAGLLLTGLFAFDQNSDWRTRLAAVERAPRITSEELNALEGRIELQQANASALLEQKLAEQLELSQAQALADAQRIAGLQARIEEQHAALEEQRQRLAEWEMDWRDVTPATVQREFYEQRTKQETLESALELAQRKTDEREQRSALQLRELAGRLESSLGGPDTEKLWNDLVGPVVQLIGDTSVGSGVLLESRPLESGAWTTNVLTAWHVVRDILGAPDNLRAPVPVKIYSPDGTWRSSTAHLLLHDVRLDLALLVLDTQEHVPYGAHLATRAELDALHTFDGVYAVGCPLGNDPIPTVGELASTHHEIDGGKYWMISAPTYIGNSGGGIYCARSHALVGIFSKIYTHGSTRSTIVPHMGLATPMTTVYDWLETSEYAYLEPQGLRADTQTAAAKR